MTLDHEIKLGILTTQLFLPVPFPLNIFGIRFFSFQAPRDCSGEPRHNPGRGGLYGAWGLPCRLLNSGRIQPQILIDDWTDLRKRRSLSRDEEADTIGSGGENGLYRSND